MSLSGFLGRAGHLGLGTLSVSFGLGPLTYQPFVPPGPPPLVLLPGFFGPTAASDPTNVAAIYARAAGLPMLYPVGPPVGPSPSSSENNVNATYLRGWSLPSGKEPSFELGMRLQSDEDNAAPIYARGAALPPAPPKDVALKGPEPKSDPANAAPIYGRRKPPRG